MNSNNIALTTEITGARLFKDITPDGTSRFPGDDSGSNPSNLTEFDGKLFFSADDGTNGSELWISDGTTNGTQLLKDINPIERYYNSLYASRYRSSSSNPSNLTEFDGKLFFSADDGTNGSELWISDGTINGTQLLKDINPGSSYRGIPSPGGRRPNSSRIANFIELDGKLFFTATDGTSGEELWVSDGTVDGTQLLKDIYPGSSFESRINRGLRPNSSGISNLTEFDGKLFFSADDGINGRELWVSDGTENGTQLLKDINPGILLSNSSAAGSIPSNLTEFDDKLFFTANDGISGPELWVSDGTTDGTQLLKDINPGISYRQYGPNYPIPFGSDISSLTEFDGKLFFTANDGINGQELWVSDGTENGTQLLKDINLGSSSNIFNLTEVNGKLFFTANDGINGQELWVSDGTENGTQLLKDINPPNQQDGYISKLVVAGNLFFFTTGFDGELWISNGTREGTLLYQDINPEGGSFPEELTVVGNQLFFTADDGVTGKEPWVLNIPDNLVVGDANNNILSGNAGVDLISGLDGNDIIRGRGNNDTLDGASGDDVLFGDEGNDRLSGRAGNDQIFGDQGNDGLSGGAGNDILEGGTGDDELQGDAGDDVINAGSGNDSVRVTDFLGVDNFDGGPGTDLIRFTPTDNRNLLVSLEGGFVGDGRVGGQFFENFEQFIAGGGNDRILGDSRDTLLNGGDGNDEIRGEAGQDTLIGESGSDTLIGGQGADVLNGGLGSDVLIGDQGVNTFQFDQTLSTFFFFDRSMDVDTILNFETEDVLDFSGYLDARGSIEATRVTDNFLRINLDLNKTIQIFGTAQGLNSAETQIELLL